MKKKITKQERYEKSMEKQGYVRKRLWVPARDEQAIEGIARMLRESYRMGK